jgi:hypothetical protein
MRVLSRRALNRPLLERQLLLAFLMPDAERVDVQIGPPQ